MKPQPIRPKPGQESVWNYPRPPRLEDCSKHIKIVFNGVIIAETSSAKRVLETSHPPNYYLSPDDIEMGYLQMLPGNSWCEWKGRAGYYTIAAGDKKAVKAAWYYPNPSGRFESLKNYVAFYASLMDACYINNEQVQPQPGNFYGGWITSDIVGPFKGEIGTSHW